MQPEASMLGLCLAAIRFPAVAIQQTCEGAVVDFCVGCEAQQDPNQLPPAQTPLLSPWDLPPKKYCRSRLAQRPHRTAMRGSFSRFLLMQVTTQGPKVFFSFLNQLFIMALDMDFNVWWKTYGATGATYMHNDHILIKIDIMNPIYCSLQDRFASSHGNNHVPFLEISDLPPVICVPLLQDVCTVETAVQDLQGEWTRWRPGAFRGVG